MAVLRELSGGREFPLRGPVTTIGRAPDCDVVLADLHVSSQHARICRSGDGYTVEDLRSANGTFVNGQRIQQRTALRANDRLEFFGTVLTFLPDESAGRAAPAVSLADRPAVVPPSTIVSSLDVTGDLREAVAAEAKLRAVLEISKNLSTSLDVNEVLPKILESLFAIFPQADRGFILLRDPNTGQLVPRAVRDRHGQEGEVLSLSQTILEYALRTGRAVLSADAARDERFDPSQSIRMLHIRSILCVPMLSRAGDSLGVLQIDTLDKLNQFRQEDLDVLVSASTQAARALELVYLHQERRDLEAATQIQKSFLPGERPRVEGLEFFDYYSAAQHIGGDYYDYIHLPGNRLAVALGDVSGKGVPAALLMARLSVAVRSCLATAPTVPEAVRQLNGILTRTGCEDRFVTFVVAVLDLNDFTLTLANAGHLPPLRRRARGAQVDSVGEEVVDLPLGIFDRPYEQMVIPLEPGDAFVLYTDGVSEARNPQNDLYGVERLRDVVKAAAEDMEALGAAILADVRQFAAGRPQNDDLTLVCFRRQGSS